MRQLVVFDLETTGLDRKKDQIIQFAGMKIDRDTNKVIDTLDMYIQPVGSYSISVAAYFKHHINAEFLKDKPHLGEVADKIIEFFGDDSVDVLTYNGLSFDMPFLKTELERVGKTIDFTKRSCYDAFLEEKRRNGINLENTYLRYKGKTMEEAGLSAHDALSDIKATYSVFYAQQARQEYKPEVMLGDDNFIVMGEFDGRTCPVFNVGKYRCVSLDLVKRIDMNYLSWCISDKSGLSESTKQYIRESIEDK